MANNSGIYDTLADLKEELMEGTDFRVLSLDHQSNVSIISPHGGFIEPGTSHLARAIAGETFNLYDFQGLKPKAPWRLHVTSTKFRDEALTAILSCSIAAISIHGMGKTDRWRIWTGGLNSELKFLVEACLLESRFWVNPNPPRYKGRSRKNLVNLVEKHGVQLELPEDLLRVMFKDGKEFANLEPEPTLSPVGEHFVSAVRRALFLYLPGRLLPKPA